MKKLKIAILHEILVKIGGAEKVVEKLLNIFPDSSLFTLIYDEKKTGEIFPREKINPQVFKLKTQKVYNLTKNQRLCLLFMSRSVESLDFSDYDVLITSSSAFAHGAITKPETKFIVYYHSPARYLWDWTNEYKKDIGWEKGLKGYILNKVFLKLRIWDYIASNRADIVLANSKNTKKRIKKYYKKDSEILYPPIETSKFAKIIAKKYTKKLENYYIIVSALTEFKKIDIAIKAFNKMPEKNLIVVGDGNHKTKLEKLVKNKNIELVGFKSQEELVYLVQNSLGLIFPGEEDFGIVPIEAMSAGKAVFALNKGGLKESVLEGITGEFFTEASGKDFVSNFLEFDKKNVSGFYKKEACIKQAKKFDEKIFEERIKEVVYKTS